MSDETDDGAAPRLRHERLSRMATRRRLTLMVAAGVVAGVLTGVFGSWVYAPLAGWDVAAGLYTSMVWIAVGTMTPAQTAAHTSREDPGRAVSDLIVVDAAIASLLAVGVVLAQASGADQVRAGLIAGLGLVSIGLSWSIVHTVFMLRYARLYYAGTTGGIDFKQRGRPRYLDFAYVAFTVGMTFQVSDTDLGTSQIRATVLRQALISYLFGAVILAAAINLVVGITTSH